MRAARAVLPTLAGLICLWTTACSAGFSGGGQSAGEAGGGTTGGSVGVVYGATDTGTKTLQRLGAIDFDNSVHDLTGTQLTLGISTFPADNLYGAFDNVGSSLGLPVSLLQAWTDATVTLGSEVAASASDANTRTQIYLKVAPCAAQGNVTAASCLQRVAEDFGALAWRRPLTDDEVAAVVQLAGASASDLPTQVGTLVTVLLSSPHFMFRVETDPNPSSTELHALTGYELASRLSYFVWRSGPDAALMAAAKSGSLSTDDGLREQLARMLADPRARSLVTGFGENWVGLRRLAEVTPSASIFPNYSDAVGASMRAETDAFLAEILLGQAPITEMLTANYSYLDGTLADYYGVAGPTGSTPVKTTLPAQSGRVGLLSQGTMLIVGSTGASSSAVRRGFTVLTQLLCQQLGNPPNNVNNLAADSNVQQTQRQSLMAHVDNPACSGCHVDMDAIGFAFEGFSGAGEKRSLDNNLPIDTTGTYDGNTRFVSNVDLAPLLAADPRFTRCFTQMLFVYALGRAPTDADQTTLDGLHQSLLANEANAPKLIEAIVLSQAFRSRRGGA